MEEQVFPKHECEYCGIMFPCVAGAHATHTYKIYDQSTEDFFEYVCPACQEIWEETYEREWLWDRDYEHGPIKWLQMEEFKAEERLWPY